MSVQSKIFMVTGLPRSRSAFLATFLTWGNTMCFHDAMHRLNSLNDLREKLDGYLYSHRFLDGARVGISDPASLLYWRHLRKWYPEAPWVVIRRNVHEASKASWKAFGTEIPFYFVREMNALIEEVQPLVVDFPEVTDRCAEIAAHCGVDVGPKERVEQLCRMQIQVEPKLLKAKVERLLVDPPAWFEEVRSSI